MRVFTGLLVLAAALGGWYFYPQALQFSQPSTPAVVPEVKAEPARQPLPREPRPAFQPPPHHQSQPNRVIGQMPNPVSTGGQNPALSQYKQYWLAQAEIWHFQLGTWDVELKNQIRMVEKDIASKLSEKKAAARIAEYHTWMLRRQGQGNYPYTAQGLAQRKSQWQEKRSEIPRRLDDILRRFQEMKTVNDEALENVRAHIDFLRS